MKCPPQNVLAALLMTALSLAPNEYSKARAQIASPILSGAVSQFSFSPNGKQIAFARRTALGSRIWVADFNGQNAHIVSQGTRVARNYNDFDPSWRSDGALIAFSSNRGGNFDLYAVRATGGALQQITKTPIDERAPQWSPRAFGLFRPSDIETHTIVGRSTKNVAPSDLKLLQSLAQGGFDWKEYKDNFNVQPLARYYKLLCVAGNGVSQQIVTMRENGTLRQTLTTGMKGAHFAPVWERSADTIAFAHRTAQGDAIYQASYPDTTDLNENVDEKNPRLGVELGEWRKSIRRLTIVPRTTAMNWTPNGQYVAVASGKTLLLAPRAETKQSAIRLLYPAQGFAWLRDGKTALFATPENGRTRFNRVLVSSPLLDIENIGDWGELTPRDRQFLAKNGFVAAGEPEAQMYHVYENTDYANLPVFVTSDSLLHLNHLMFDYLLRGIETDELMPTTIALVNHHLVAARNQMTKAPRAQSEAAARNMAFFAVAAKLALGEVETGKITPQAVGDDDALGKDRAAMRARTMRAQNALLRKRTAELRKNVDNLPAETKSLANQELELIRKHAGLSSSPIFGGRLTLGTTNTALQDERINYSDFQPRGHYTRSEVLRRYFLMAHWLSGAPFRRTTDGARRVLLMMQANDAMTKARHAKIVRVLDTFVGGADDDDFAAYEKIARGVWGSDNWNAREETKLAQFVEKINALPLPRIAPSRGAAFRFLPQPYTVDAEAMQNLTYDGTPPDVGTIDAPRYFALGLDVMGVLGSNRARQILDNTSFQGAFFDFGLKETQYKNYDAQFASERQKFAAFSSADWQHNLYTRTLYSILPLLKSPSSTRYKFTRTQAWADKSLNTALGAWAELKHDTMPKQPVAPEAGGEGGLSETPLWEQPRGFVEPSPQVIARLLELAREEKRVLVSIGYLTSERKQRLDTYIALLTMLSALENKQNRGVPLSPQEVEQLRFYGAFQEHLTLVTAEGEGGSMEGPDMAIIADVASAYSTRLQKLLALQEGVGHALPIYVAVERNGHREIARGAVFTYYEFTQPAENRLTDEAWRDLLRDNPPKLPTWTSSFISRTKDDE